MLQKAASVGTGRSLGWHKIQVFTKARTYPGDMHGLCLRRTQRIPALQLLHPGTPWHEDASPSGPSWRPSFHRNLSMQKPDFSEMKPVREAGQPLPQQMFLTPALNLPTCCSSSVVSSVAVAQDHAPWRVSPCRARRDGQPVYTTCHWKSNPLEICGCRVGNQHHSHLQKGPPTMGAPWPSSSLLLPLQSCHSSDSIGGTEWPQKPLLFTCCTWPRNGEGDGAKPWSKPHFDDVHVWLWSRPALQNAASSCVQWRSPLSRGGIQTPSLSLQGFVWGHGAGWEQSNGQICDSWPSSELLFWLLIGIMT